MTRTKNLILCLLLFLTAAETAYGQERTAGGVVIDKSNGKPLEYISVYFKHTSSGCLTNYRGEFFVKDPSGADTLVVDAIGYEKADLVLREHRNTNLRIEVSPATILLEGAVVKPKRERYKKKGNPAIELIRNVIAHKDSNRIESSDYYRCKLYEKLTLSLDDFRLDLDKKEKRNFLKEHVDTSEITGKPILTLSIRENMGDYYYRRSPKEYKTVRQAQRHVGLDREFDNNGGLSTSLELLFTGVNIFDDEVRFLMNRFVSPISSALATAYYKYYIMGTVQIDGEPCTDLSFVPYNSQSYGFTGRMYITQDGNFSIKKIQLNFPSNSNINWIDKLRIDQEFQRTDGGVWALKQEDSYVNLAIIEGTQGIFAHQTRYFSDYSDDPAELQGNPAYKIDGPIETLPGAENLDSGYWADNRPLTLTRREQNIENVTKDFSEKTSAVTWMRVIDALFTEWIPTSGQKATSKFDIGPILSIAGSNYIEGPRFRLGGMTTANLSDRWFGNGYLAYGLHDHKFKGSLSLIHSFNKKHYHPNEYQINNLSASWTYDIYTPETIGEQHDLLTSLKAGPAQKLQYIRRANLKYERQWTNSLRTTFMAENAKYTPATKYGPGEEGTLRYEYVGSDGNMVQVPNLTSTEISAQVRWAPGEKHYNSVSTRKSLDKDTPIFSLKHTVGIKDFLGGEYDYNRTEFNMFNRFRLSVAGFMDAKMSVGKVWNQVPWPLLPLPSVNQSITYGRENFHMMNALEFISDQYAQLHLTWHMKGMIFNRIPLLKKLKFRELLIFNCLYGDLSDKNNPALTPGLLVLPEGTMPIGKMPYMEVGIGIENILQVFKIVYYQRLTYRDSNPNPLGKWGGIRIGIYEDF